MGSGNSDARRDRAVGQHVEAIQVLLGDTMLALVLEDEAGRVYVVTPEHARFVILDLLRRVDWNHAYVEEAESQDSL